MWRPGLKWLNKLKVEKGGLIKALYSLRLKKTLDKRQSSQKLALTK